MEKKKIESVLAAGLCIGGIVSLAIFRVMRKGKKTEAVQAQPTQEPTKQNGEPHSRVERMFGDRSTWTKSGETTQPARKGYKDGYKGFLFIECEGCGEERRFFAKAPYTFWRCKCGHTTELQDLRPAFCECVKCGNPTIKYWTNSRKDKLVIDCKTCDAPVDLALNRQGTAWATVKDETER